MPIAWQRVTRKERYSGRTWPTHCNKPNWAPSAIDVSGRTVAHGERCCKWENGLLKLTFFLKACSQSLAAYVPLFEYLSSPSVVTEVRENPHF